jgi:hypothetical protein
MMIRNSSSISWAVLAFCTVLAVPGCQKNRPSETSAAQDKPEAASRAQAEDRPEGDGILPGDEGADGETPVPLREPDDQYWMEEGGDEEVEGPDEERDDDDYEDEELDDAYSEEI